MYINDRSRFRMYKGMLNKWTDEDGRVYMREYEYVEYNLAGERVGYGSEDWSREREKEYMKSAFVYTWDGEKRNKGGKRRFEIRGYIVFNKEQRAIIKEYYKRKYNAEEVQIRTF